MNETKQRSMDMNRKRRFVGEDVYRKEELNEKLKVLNAVVEKQALRLRSIEVRMSKQEDAA